MTHVQPRLHYIGLLPKQHNQDIDKLVIYIVLFAIQP